MPKPDLKDILLRPGVLAVPGIYDGLSLRLADQAGFEAAFLSGAGLSMARYGRPDLGYVGLSELADSVSAMTETTTIPLIVDMDTGFGNALSVARAVTLLEGAGACALQMEDQTSPKRCGHLKGKDVIPVDEMVGKIRAAVEARRSPDTLIFARTDALAVTGFDDAMERGEAYLAAGADALFIEAPRDMDQMRDIGARFGEGVPLIHNFVEGGRSPVTSAAELEPLGYRIALFPLAFLHAAIPAGRAMLDHLKTHGQTQSWPGEHDDLAALNSHVGLQEMLDKSDKYS